MEKRGMSHIEVVLSFVLFISAVIFIFSIFNVPEVTKFNESSLAYVKYEMNSMVKVELKTYSVVINESNAAGKQVIAVDLGENLLGNQFVRVESYEGDLLPSMISISRNIVYVERQGERFFKIFVSEDLPQSGAEPATQPPLIAQDYTISSRDSVQILSERRIVELKRRYDTEYSTLKNDLKVGDRLDFAFAVEFAGESIKAEKDIPSRTEVSADNKREEVLRLDGTREYADYIVKVW